MLLVGIGVGRIWGVEVGGGGEGAVVVVVVVVVVDRDGKRKRKPRRHRQRLNSNIPYYPSINKILHQHLTKLAIFNAP